MKGGRERERKRMIQSLIKLECLIYVHLDKHTKIVL